MSPLFIKETKHTPLIVFDEARRVFEISGISRPEDVELFFSPVFEWIDKEAANLVVAPLTMKVDFLYFNSATTKMFARLLKKFSVISNNQSLVVWYYDHDDDEALEAGKDFAQISQMPFQFIAK